MLTDLLLYFVGRKYGQQIVSHKRFHKIISPKKLSLMVKKFRRWGIFVVLFGRHLVGLRAQILLVAGVMKMPLLKFVVTDALSASLTVAFMVGAGYVGGNSLQIIKKDITRVEHVALFLTVALLACYLLFRYLVAGRRASR